MYVAYLRLSKNEANMSGSRSNPPQISGIASAFA